MRLADLTRPAKMFHVEQRTQRRFWLMAMVAGAALRTATSVGAPATAPAIDPALLARLEAIDAKIATVHDLSALFTQRKFSPLLKKPLVTAGTVRAVGDGMLWLTETPRPTRLRIDGQSMRLLDLGQKTLEIYPLQGKLASMAASPLPRLATLREKFEIEERAVKARKADTVSLTLRPRDDELKTYVDHVDVDLNERLGVVERFDLTDPDGERAEITFADPKLNTGLTAKDLELNPPAGTKTARPLDAGAP